MPLDSYWESVLIFLGNVMPLSVAYVASGYRDAFSSELMILILLFRPQGLFGVGQPGR